nr:immunoglobulin heavy chain junction region [Mus musculus]
CARYYTNYAMDYW